MTTWTAAQRRDAARRAYNADLADCPGHQVMAILSSKWASLIVEALAEGPRRHGRLAARIPGATQKMLTQSLRALERDGLLVRTVTATVPVRVDYALTALGQDFLQLQRNVKEWADAHAGRIADARARHDGAAPDRAPKCVERPGPGLVTALPVPRSEDRRPVPAAASS